MKFIAMCAAAALSLSMISCGGSYDNEKVKAINDVNDGKYTTEQEEYGLELYLAFQQEEIDELKDQISNVEEKVDRELAKTASDDIYNATSKEGSETESYKAVKDQVVKNAQEIKKLTEDLEKAEKEYKKKLGYEVKD